MWEGVGNIRNNSQIPLPHIVSFASHLGKDDQKVGKGKYSDAGLSVSNASVSG